VREKIPAARRKDLLERLGISSRVCLFVGNKSGQIVGHIDSKTAKKWLDWYHGELYVVSWNGGFVFCFEGGTIVPV